MQDSSPGGHMDGGVPQILPTRTVWPLTSLWTSPAMLVGDTGEVLSETPASKVPGSPCEWWQ